MLVGGGDASRCTGGVVDAAGVGRDGSMFDGSWLRTARTPIQTKKSTGSTATAAF
jgi:hypothetical protein